MHEINFDEVMRLQREGYISVREHRTLPLLIFNYTHKAQFDRMWTPETRACRGLITTKDFEIVARPFEKFFNYEEYQGDLPVDGEFEVYEKMDGSLIVVTMYQGALVVATRGSFTSEQALHAQELLNKDYASIEFLPGRTYLMEVLYPENRIVIDYGTRNELVLLAIVDTVSGQEFELPEKTWQNMNVVKRYDGVKDFSTLTKEPKPNFEGYVVRWKNNFRLKIKFDDYKRLHRIITGANSKTIWEILRDGKNLDDVLGSVPDEFYKWVRAISENLLIEYKKIEDECNEIYRNTRGTITRKDMAEQFTTTKYADILFLMLDRKDYSKNIWKRLRPKAERPFKDTSEDT